MSGVAGMEDFFADGIEHLAFGWALVAARISGVLLFAPVFSSAAISARVKTVFVLAVTVLVAPTVSARAAPVSMSSLLGELSVGLALGLSLGLLTEMLNFAGSLLSMEFSFSLVNLIDPNSRVETAVLGQVLGWIGVLVILGSGLHRTLLAAVMHSFTLVPAGHAILLASSGTQLAHMASGIFLVGVQLASPVIAAAMAVEVTVALMARLAPQLPAMVLSVPLKTAVSFVVLIGSLGVWPWLIERRFTALLDAAGAMVGVR